MEDLVEILNVFPKDKSAIKMDAILEYCKTFADDEEVKRSVAFLSNHGEVKRYPDGGYAITEKGLDAIADDATLEDYVIRKLAEHNGIYNLNLLDGRKFKNETEKFATIQRLENRQMIEHVKKGLGNTYMLTDTFKFHEERKLFSEPMKQAVKDVGTIGEYLQRKDESKPTRIEIIENNEPKQYFKLLRKMWAFLATHPIWSTVVGTIVAALILKYVFKI